MSLTEQAIELDGVTLRVHVTGDGPTIVFVHGVWVAGPLWDDVVQRLDGMRCIVPTWPLGAHADPAPAADLSARATARRIPELLESLDLRDVTLVGNDTGGGLCLAALGTQHPGLQRIGRLVLTNCDSYEHFPPKGFDTMVALTRRAPALGSALLRFFASSVFPLDHARRLRADFADARLEVIDGASTFVMLDQPDELAAKITTFRPRHREQRLARRELRRP